MPGRRTDIFTALPAYFGGKRRLLPAIFGALAEVLPPAAWPDVVFLDPFLGGGSVSLSAKARGFAVSANDCARRAVIVGQALIANSSVRLDASDAARLFRAPPGPIPQPARAALVPQVFSRAQADFLDRALWWAQQAAPPRDALLQLVLIKWALRCQPLSVVNASDAAAANQREWDRVSPRRAAHYARAQAAAGPAVLRDLIASVNRGVFAGTGQVQQGDAVEFLAQAAGDVVYFDPPYPGTTRYERIYAALDALLEGTPLGSSAYSGSDPPLDALLDAARAVPVWLISIDNHLHDLDAWQARVRRHRPRVTARSLRYAHLPAVATEATHAAHREYVLCARA